jgi:TPP-dependent 2-oxoacid decarboxylase
MQSNPAWAHAPRFTYALGNAPCFFDDDAQVTTEEELVDALKKAKEEKQDHLCFIECIVHRDDTSKELLEWGSRVASANSRPPNPQ